MKRIVLITLFLLAFAVFGQTDNEVRIKQEKQFDFQAHAKNAAHKVMSKNVAGVDLTEDQIQKLREKVDYYNMKTVELILGTQVEPKPELIDSLKLFVDELVAGAEEYFWKSPRANSIQKVQLALIKDMSGVDYLIENYRTRIYSAQHEYVLEQLNKIKEL